MPTKRELERRIAVLERRVRWLRTALARIRDRDTEWFNLPLETHMALTCDAEQMRAEVEAAGEYAAGWLARDDLLAACPEET